MNNSKKNQKNLKFLKNRGITILSDSHRKEPKLRKKLNEIIKNGHLGMLAVFFFVYMVTFSYIENRDVHHYIIHTTIDDKIPFCEYFIIPYLLWFAFVAITVLYFMFCKHENKEQWKEYYQLIITLGTGMTLFLIISLVFPNGQDLRPVLTGDSIFIKAVQFIYHTDTPTNVLPSIHVFNSLACCMAILKNQRKHFKKTTDILTVVLTILIIMSTMFLKQHSVVDVVLAALMYTGCYRVVYGKEVWQQNAFCSFLFTNR